MALSQETSLTLPPKDPLVIGASVIREVMEENGWESKDFGFGFWLATMFNASRCKSRASAKKKVYAELLKHLTHGT